MLVRDCINRCCMLSLLHHMMYIVFCKNIDVYLYLHKLSLFLTSSRSDYIPADISQKLRERGVKRPPPLREDDPRIVGGARLETIPATTTIP